MDKRNFIITSHGWSASNWVANAFNLHPDITCTHSAINILPDEKLIHEESGLKKNITKFHVGYKARIESSLNSSYDLIHSLGNTSVYGSVHLYRLRDIEHQLRISQPMKYEFAMVNLVRNPVNLVWSGYGQFKELFRFDLNELHWTLGKLLNTDKDFVFDLANKYNLYTGDFENLAFICSCRVLESLKLDLCAMNFVEKLQKGSGIDYKGSIMMESITTNPLYLKETFQKLNLNDLKFDETYTDKVYSTGKLNKHKKEDADKSAMGIFNLFSDWQKEVFIHFFEKYQLRDAYSEMGYDFNFIK